MQAAEGMMFDLGGRKKAQQANEALDALVTMAREEHSALTAILNRLEAPSATLVQTTEALQKVDTRILAATAGTEALERRIQQLEGRAASLGDLEERVQALLAATSAAHRQIEKLAGPDGDFEQHRREVRVLATHISETQAAVAAIAEGRATFEKLWQELKASSAELTRVQESIEAAAALGGELEHLRTTTTQMTQDVAAIRDASREADDNAFAAAEAVKTMERRLGDLEAVRALSDTIEEKLASLNALAEQVGQKVRAVDAQKQVIDRAVEETDRLNEIVWKMESQMSRLDAWLSRTDHTEERLRSLDSLVAEVAARIDVTATVSDQFRSSFQGLVAQADELATKQASLDTLHGQLARVHEMSERAAADIEGFRQSQADLDALEQHVHDFHHAYTGAAELCEKLAADRAAVEQRLDALNDSVTDVDQRLAAQLARRTELDALKDQCEGVVRQLTDIQERASAITLLQERMSPVETRLNLFEERLESIGRRFKEVRREEAELRRHESQLTELADANRALAEQATARMHAMYTLVAELARSAPSSHEVMEELARLEGRQREALAQAESLEAKLAELAESPEPIDALQSKSTLIELLEAVRANLKTVNEQKAMVDRLNGRLASVQFVIQEAHQTLQMLNQERALVERTDDRIRQLRKGPGVGP